MDLAPDAVAAYQAAWRKYQGYLDRLNRHPDCRDPDHPGCEQCTHPDELPQEPYEL